MAIDWENYQEVLDEAFHAAEDAYPAGSPEHRELLDFVPRLHKEKLARSKSAASAAPPVQPEGQQEAARALGIPATYDLRYRISAAVVTDQKRLARAARRIDQINSKTDAPSNAALPTGREVVEEYKQALPVYENFYQKRAAQKLRKLLADKAALPIAGFEGAIIDALRTSPAIVVAGDTGCGKSTQLPQFLIRAGYSHVACTQPRRISAISLCRRVAFETLQEHGDDVAYKVRFDSTAGRGTRVTFVTEGVLLRMLGADPLLPQYQVVIIDEVHERHLNTDLLLALTRALLLQRPDLRVVVMSATINVQAYSDYFGAAPVITVPGRLHPISVSYLAQRAEGTQRRSAAQQRELAAKGGRRQAIERIDPTPYLRLLQQIDQTVAGDERGDLLVFLAGMEDISAVAEALREHAARTRRWLVLPLHSALSVEEQDRVFDIAPEGVRKAILSTNIAETSVTIDGVRFVADSGRAKEMLHDVASAAASLQEGWISKASADQRKGRAGRTGPGQCFRMYSEADYEAFPAFATPEIHRVRLEAVVLQIKMLTGSAADPRAFGFIEPPKQETLEAAVTSLKQAGALDAHEALTQLGGVLSALPVDVAVGKLLVLGCAFGCAEPALTMAAALSVQSPFLRLPGGTEAEGVRERRSELESEHGDAFTLLAMFDEWIKVKARQQEPTRKWCKKRALEEQRLIEMAKLRAQFEGILAEAGLRARPSGSGAHGSGMAGRRWGSEGGGPQGRRASKEQVRALQRQQERERGRRVLAMDAEEGASSGSGGNEGGQDGEGRPRRQQKRRRHAEEDKVDLRALDLEASVNVRAMATAALARLTAADVNLLKCLLAASLYPQVAVPDPRNAMRRGQDAMFLTCHNRAGAAIHPGSVLAARASEVPPDTALLFVEALETRRAYLGNLTPLPALPGLLLSAERVDTDAAGRRFLVDGWLLLRVADGAGPAVAEAVNRLRVRTAALLVLRLSRARIPGLTRARAESTAAAPSWSADAAAEGPALARRIARDWAALSDAAAPRNSEAERDLEEVTAAGLACALEWPARCSVEVLSSTAAAAELAQEGDAAAEGTPAAPPRRAGVQAAPWLRVGSLRDRASQGASHARMPALRRRWRCPGCREELVEDVAALREHLRGCEAAQPSLQNSSPDALLEAGYLPAGPASAGARGERAGDGNGGVDELMQGGKRLEWGRRAGVGGVSQGSVGGAERPHAEGSGERWSVGPPAIADAMEGLDQAAADIATELAASARREKAERIQAAEEDRADELALLRKRAQAEGMRREHWCSVCGRTFMLTPTEILQHRRSHST